MTTVLHRAQPLPLARLHTGVVLAVVVLHIGVLCLANLNWPLPTMVSGQVFAKARHSFFPGNHSNYQTVSNAGRQRFGRAETMLSLGNVQTNRSMPLVKGAGITSLATTAAKASANADAPLSLGLTPCYIGCPPMALER